tara:strand:+ start:282 stop:950 length:669 start_codon:yes stop_codon:yes gene_type:complete
MKYIIISKKKWDQKNFEGLDHNFIFLNKVNYSKIKKINPKIIFFIHWSKIIAKKIYNNYLCIQFHSSNLPNGRGGSPIQNQILLGAKRTKLTAFKISKKLDAGPICLKKNLSLKGSAEEIFRRMELISIKMINKISKSKKLKFNKQLGRPTFFKRRKNSESRIKFNKSNSVKKLYDFLRMLDAPDYPKAFIELNKFRFTFQNIRMNKKAISAFVEIKKNEKR